MSNVHPTFKPGQPDPLRRKLAKGGIALPVVLATLASKPVLGAAPYNCTISGKISGGSTHGVDATCNHLGQPFSYWLSPLSNWYPCDYFFTNCPLPTVAGARKFHEAPLASGLDPFVDAYWKNGTDSPSVYEVLRSTSAGRPPLTITSKTLASVELGREAVVALLNALSPSMPDYPLLPQDVITIFNTVARTGSYTTDFNEEWSQAVVLQYFKSLHG
ncbi:MAG: hypothetical protein Q8M09_12785 [Pseudomonadota bacterium]|nr:hypothetical protein [Pseudomonadota bacterium]MDP1905103.1 hypothetical protein [Pseudomonadota bacterium]MDP2354414.1 hypothetical protein [Pseudomonadota bacterium]